jgi:predicted nucleotide-binding protein (sugar kinase/HSP70/actin superfamily)
MASKSTLSDLISKCKKFFSSDVAKDWKELYEKWNDLYKKWKETLAAAKKKNKSD